MITPKNLSPLYLVFILCVIQLFLFGCQNDIIPKTKIYNADVKTVTVPIGSGRPVMTDGMFQPGEWDDASEIKLTDTFGIFIKQYQGHFYFAVDARNLISPMANVYFCCDGKDILQLHVSAQLSERMLHVDTLIPQDTVWAWGKSDNWYANEYRWDRRLRDSLMRIEGVPLAEVIKLTSMPQQAIEFDFLKSKLIGDSWKFRIEIGSPSIKGNLHIFPANTKRDKPKSWMTLNF